MKKLLSYLIIIFFSSLTFSFSEDISDFQIEGISVDDSVLDYFTEETLEKESKKIKTRSDYNFNKSSYGEAEASGVINETSIPSKNLKTYDDVRVTYFSETILALLILNLVPLVSLLSFYRTNILNLSGLAIIWLSVNHFLAWLS